jgi:hypothetical protein
VRARRVRQDEAAKHGFDIKAILAGSKKRQRRSRHKGRIVCSKNEIEDEFALYLSSTAILSAAWSPSFCSVWVPAPAMRTSSAFAPG